MINSGCDHSWQSVGLSTMTECPTALYACPFCKLFKKVVYDQDYTNQIIREELCADYFEDYDWSKHNHVVAERNSR